MTIQPESGSRICQRNEYRIARDQREHRRKHLDQKQRIRLNAYVETVAGASTPKPATMLILIEFHSHSNTGNGSASTVASARV